MRKIPPTSENLFNKQSFPSTIEKAGGVSKVFWPLRAPTQNKAAAQAQPYQQAQAMPSHASNYAVRMPSMLSYNNLPLDNINRPPFQSGWNAYNLNNQGREYPRPSYRSNTYQVRPSCRSAPQTFQGAEMYSSSSRGQNKTSSQSGPRRSSKRKF